MTGDSWGGMEHKFWSGRSCAWLATPPQCPAPFSALACFKKCLLKLIQATIYYRYIPVLLHLHTTQVWMGCWERVGIYRAQNKNRLVNWQWREQLFSFIVHKISWQAIFQTLPPLQAFYPRTREFREFLGSFIRPQKVLGEWLKGAGTFQCIRDLKDFSLSIHVCCNSSAELDHVESECGSISFLGLFVPTTGARLLKHEIAPTSSCPVAEAANQRVPHY